MGTIIGSEYLDNNAIQFDGVNQYAARVGAFPWLSHSQGAWAFDLTLLSFPGGTGNDVRSVINAGVYAAGKGLFFISCRRNSGYGDTAIRLDIAKYNGSGATFTRAPSAETITIGVKRRYIVQSDGKMFIDGVEASVYLSYNGNSWTGDWYSAMPGVAANYEQRFAGEGDPGSPPARFGNIRLNNVVYYSSPLTASEALADYNGGRPQDPRERPDLAAKALYFWPFDGHLNDIIGGQNLTAYNSPTYPTP